MSVQVLISGVDLTDKLIKESFNLKTSDTTQSSFKAKFKLTTEFIQFGEEVIVNDTTSGTVLMFGGIINDPKQQPHNNEFKEVSIDSNGYQILATHIDLLQTNFVLSNAGQIITEIVTEKLIPEGITIGQIDDGITNTSYVVTATTINKIFDDLAQASGFRWWITKEKEFFFAEAPVITTSAFNYDTILQPSGFLEAAGLPTYREQGSDYRNKHIFKGFNAEDQQIVGFAQNIPEQTRMAVIFGTGLFAKVEDNQNIVQAGEAITAAEARIAQFPNLPASLKLPVFDNAVQTGTTFFVNIPILGVDDETYLIQDIQTKYFAFNGGDENKEFLSTMDCIRYELGLQAQQRSTWADKWLQGVKLRNDLNSKDTDTFTKHVFDQNDGETINVSTVEAKRSVTLNVKSKTNIIIMGAITGYTATNGANQLTINIYKNSVLINSNCADSFNNLSSYTDPDTVSFVKAKNHHTINFALIGEAGDQSIDLEIGLLVDEGSFTIDPSCYLFTFMSNGFFAGDSVQVPFIQISELLDLDDIEPTFNFSFDNPIITDTITTAIITPLDISFTENLAPSILDTTFNFTFDDPIVSESITTNII